MENGCAFFHGGLVKCDDYEKEKKYYTEVVEKSQSISRQEFLKPSEKTKYHYWLSCRMGFVWALRKDYELYPEKGNRYKYLGFTYDLGWPKKMNTGRLLHKPTDKARKRQRKARKKLGFR